MYELRGSFDGGRKSHDLPTMLRDLEREVSRTVPSRTSAHSNASHQYFIADIPHVNSSRFYDNVIPTVAATTTTPLNTNSLQECSTEWPTMRRNFYLACHFPFFIYLTIITCINEISTIFSDIICFSFKHIISLI